MKGRVLMAIALGAAVALPGTPAFAAAPKAPKAPVVKKYVNCTALQHDFAHGVARTGGIDKVTGKTKPVTTFAVNTAVYNANKRLDADNDGVACEKR